MINEGIKAIEDRRYDEAVRLFDRVLKKDPSNFQALYFIGIAHRNLQNFNDAKVSLNKALQANPQNASILSEIGITVFQDGDKEGALIYFDKAVAAEPQNPYRYSSRAYIRASAKMINEAITDYEKAIELDPGDEIARNNLGLLFEQKGRMNEAKQQYSESDKLNKHMLSEKEREDIRKKEIERHEAAQEVIPEVQQTPKEKPKLTFSFYLKTLTNSLFSKEGRKEFLGFLKKG